MSLVGTATTVSITLTPGYTDSEAPAVLVYTFDVNFVTSCTITSLSFLTQTSDQTYNIYQSLFTSDDYSLQYMPQACATATVSMISSPDATSFLTHDAVA